ncbi:hypothetical protein EV368DRAFT_67922 [Lentinula lateritia]|nr:hypothetical protein EV368DRAFT_67922 [Lentinula lateritia]
MYAFMQTALVADANTSEVTTNELAVQHLKDQWEAHVRGLRTQYQAQLQEAEALTEQRRQEAAEAEELAKAGRLEKEKELSKETEKKCLPIYSFQKGLGVDSIPLQLHVVGTIYTTCIKTCPHDLNTPPIHKENDDSPQIRALVVLPP